MIAEQKPLLDPADLYHTRIIVEDIERAKVELSAQLGLTWAAAGTADQPTVYEGVPATMSFGDAYSAGDAHRIELVQAIPGTSWEVSDQRSAHHLGYWVDDLAGMAAGLVARGLPLVARVGTDQPDGPVPIVMHRSPLGFFVELVDRALRPVIFG